MNPNHSSCRANFFSISSGYQAANASLVNLKRGSKILFHWKCFDNQAFLPLIKANGVADHLTENLSKILILYVKIDAKTNACGAFNELHCIQWKLKAHCRMAEPLFSSERLFGRTWQLSYFSVLRSSQLARRRSKRWLAVAGEWLLAEEIGEEFAKFKTNSQRKQ